MMFELNRIGMAGLLLLTAIVAQSPTATAAPFTNGSFENFTTNAFGNANSSTLAPDNWVVSNTTTWSQAVLAGQGLPQMQAFNGDKFVTLNNSSTAGSISQTFDTTPGQVYNVSFEFTQITGNGSSQASFTSAVTVTAPDFSNLYTYPSGGGNAGTLRTDPYQLITFSFTAAPATSTSTIAFTNPTSINQQFGPTIDQVTVTAAPEPSALALIGLGAAGALRRRRR